MTGVSLKKRWTARLLALFLVMLTTLTSFLFSIYGDEFIDYLGSMSKILDKVHFFLISIIVTQFIILCAATYVVALKADERTLLKEEIGSLNVKAVELVNQLEKDSRSGLASYEFLVRQFNDTYMPMVRDGKIFSVLMIDLVNFKEINDTLGHSAGDQAISLVGAFIRTFLRDKNDMAARYGQGADEFFFVVETDEAGMTMVAKRLRTRLPEECNEAFEALTGAKFPFAIWASGTQVTEEDTWKSIKERIDKGLIKAKTESPTVTVRA